MKKSQYKAENQNGLEFLDGSELPICCGTCKHLGKMLTEEPCYICNNDYDKWERQQA